MSMEVWQKFPGEPEDEPEFGTHPDSLAFLAVLEEARELHLRKQRDYGRMNDPFANVKASEDFGIPPWVGAMVRGNDKVRRLQTFAQRGSLTNESAEDALLDLFVYVGIALVLFRQEMRKGQS